MSLSYLLSARMPLSFGDSNAVLKQAFCSVYNDYPPCNVADKSEIDPETGNLLSNKFIVFDGYRGIPVKIEPPKSEDEKLLPIFQAPLSEKPSIHNPPLEASPNFL
jgi:hypothetical protein